MKLRRVVVRKIAYVIIFALVLSCFSVNGGMAAKKKKKITSIVVENTNSKVLVVKKKRKVKLSLKINGETSKKAWKEVKFSSKNKKIVTVNKKGVITPKKTGKTTVNIRAKKGKAKIKLTVIVGTKIKKVKMNVSKKELAVGQAFQLLTTISPVKASYKKIKWSSDDADIVTVSKKGIITALKEGKTTIRAISQDGTKKTAKCVVSVVSNTDRNQTGAPSEGQSGDSSTPTAAPTGNPSVTPTPTPTIAPTGNPSVTPTPTPTIAPTGNPSVPPTPTPTIVPTGNPSVTPTPTPTIAPTGKPSVPPTPTPTIVPTGKPSVPPTPTPTIVPTGNPSVPPTPTVAPTEHPSVSPTPIRLLQTECNTMTCSGSYAGMISSPFDGVALYANGDACSTSYIFAGTNKKYRIVVKGASNNSTAAAVSIYVGDKKKGSVAFTGTELQEQTLDFKMLEETGELDISFVLENDTGANDTYVNSFELFFLEDIPEPPAAPIPVGGAVYTGNYRNMFKELGYSETEINAKVDNAWQKFFYGTEEERIYYPVGEDMAYIYTADTDDVRSEGMSYGMMICLQMNKQEEFDRLWKWAKTYMQHTSGEYKDYFAWKCTTSGNKQDNTPASDGEEYFTTALLFASARWGDGNGIYNYSQEAQTILKAMLHQSDDSQGVNMFDSTHKMPVFCPIGNAATYTDPSYHLPAFYEVWAELAEQDNGFWSDAADASRTYFQSATNATTGLGPDYSEFNGTAKNEGNHGDFRFDAWRIASNIACDYAWWGKNNWATTYANRLQGFFTEKGVENYGNQWTLSGQELSTDHSPGLVAMNAVASLAASDKQTWAFLEDLWNISPTTGKYRYYDGCLYMMGLLHCSGKFRAYLPDDTQPSVSSSIVADGYEFDKNEANQKEIKVTMTLNENTLSQIKNGFTALVEGTDYSVNDNVVTIKKSYLSSLSTGTATLNFVFSAGRNASLVLTIKDTTPGATPDIPGPYSEISADAFTDSNDVTVENGIVTFNSTDSWISFTLDFGTDNVANASVYVQEPNNSGQIYIYVDNLSNQVSTIYNLGNGSWTESSNYCSIRPGGSRTVYVKANKAGIKLDWLKFMKN